MKYVKVRNVKDPVRAGGNEAGIDFFIPEDLTVKNLVDANNKLSHNDEYFNTSLFEYFDFKMNNIHELIINKLIIKPHGRILIPSGLHVKLPYGYGLIAANKSGVAHKRGLIFGSEVVDESYQGEVHISLINTNNHEVSLYVGDKIIQFILTAVSYEMPKQIETLVELYPEKTERGTGGFGSTDEKIDNSGNVIKNQTIISSLF